MMMQTSPHIQGIVQKKCHPQVAFFDRLKLDYSGLALVPLLYAGTLVPGTVLFGLDWSRA